MVVYRVKCCVLHLEQPEDKSQLHVGIEKIGIVSHLKELEQLLLFMATVILTLKPI